MKRSAFAEPSRNMLGTVAVTANVATVTATTAGAEQAAAGHPAAAAGSAAAGRAGDQVLGLLPDGGGVQLQGRLHEPFGPGRFRRRQRAGHDEPGAGRGPDSAVRFPVRHAHLAEPG